VCNMRDDELRYFRAAVNVYEQVCAELDAAFGLPSQGQARVLPESQSVITKDGDCVLAVLAGWCELEAVAPRLGALLASGAVVELDEEAYWAARG
jgi:hypothetical protein